MIHQTVLLKLKWVLILIGYLYLYSSTWLVYFVHHWHEVNRQSHFCCVILTSMLAETTNGFRLLSRYKTLSFRTPFQRVPESFWRSFKLPCGVIISCEDHLLAWQTGKHKHIITELRQSFVNLCKLFSLIKLAACFKTLRKVRPPYGFHCMNLPLLT